MSFNDILEKEKLNISSVIGDIAVQKIVTGKVNLPAGANEIKPPLEAVIENLSQEVNDDTVTIEGNLKNTIYFKDEESEEIKDENFEASFSLTVDIPGAKPGHEVDVIGRVENTEIKEIMEESSEGKEIKYLVLVEVIITVTETLQMEVVTKIKDSKVQVDKDVLEIEEFVGRDSTRENLTGELILDYPLEEVEGIYCTFEDVRGEIEEEDKVIIKGVLAKEIYYTKEGTKDIKYKTLKKEFSLDMEFHGARPGMNVKVLPRLELINHEVKEEKELDLRATIRTFVKIINTSNIEVISEINGMNTIKSSLITFPIIAEENVMIQKEAQIELLDRIEKMGDIWGEFEKLTPEILNDKLIVKGKIKSLLWYYDKSSSIKEMAEEIPLEKLIKMEGVNQNHKVQISPRLEYIRGSIGENNYSLLGFIKGEFKVKARKEKQIKVVTGLEEFEEYSSEGGKESEKSDKAGVKKERDYKRPTFKIYVVQKNETVYDISRNVEASVDDILKANNISNPEIISSGEKLFIPVN